MELLVLFYAILGDSHMLVSFVLHRYFLLVDKVVAFVWVEYILILDLDDVLFILIDDTQQFPFDLDVVLVDLVLAEEVHLLLLDQV